MSHEYFESEEERKSYERTETEMEEEEIKKYFDINTPVEKFVKENLIEGINIKTTRKKYKKDDFFIDIDDLDFGYSCVEIELMVEDEKDILNAEEKILALAKQYNFETKEVPAKKKEYFRIVKPEVFKMLYPNG